MVVKMNWKSLPILVMAVFLMTPFVNMESVFALNGKAPSREVSTERIVFDWTPIFSNATHEIQMRVDGVAHMNIVALVTNDPGLIVIVAKVVTNMVFHGEIGLRLILRETGDTIEEIIMDFKTFQTKMKGPIFIEGPENIIVFSRAVGFVQLGEIKIRLNGFLLFKILNGEIQWTKAWVFVDHEKIPVPLPPIPIP